MGAFLDALQSTAGETETAPAASPEAAPQEGGLATQIEQHLSSLPDEQKAYLANFLTPELVNIMGILLGEEAAQFFSQYADPSKTLTVVPSQGASGEMGGQPQAAAPSQPSIGMAQGAAPAQGTPSGPMMGPVQQ